MKGDPPRVAPLDRRLEMPKYSYRDPRTGTFISRYDDVEKEKKIQISITWVAKFSASTITAFQKRHQTGSPLSCTHGNVTSRVSALPPKSGHVWRNDEC